MTTALETIVGVLKDGTKKERTFLAEEDPKPKQKHVKTCKVCKEPHSVWNCKGFKQMTVNNRWSVAKEDKVCFRSLSDGHRGEACFSSRVCRINECRSRYHQMLHEDPVLEVNTEEPSEADCSSASTSDPNNYYWNKNCTIFRVCCVENCPCLSDQCKKKNQSQCFSI